MSTLKVRKERIKILNWLFLMALVPVLIFGTSAQSAMWRADDDKVIAVELRDCEAAAEDGIKVGVEVVENSSKFRDGRLVPPHRSFQVHYYLYKDKLWWMGVYKWANKQTGAQTRAERRFFCFAGPLEEPQLQSTKN